MSTEPKPSATVVVVRDAASRLEVLLLERNTGKSIWVFPGGKVDAADGLAPGQADWEAPARRAAAREAREEAGLVLDPAGLVPISRWVTPALTSPRFDTLFFAARVGPDVLVRVDGGEISAHRWFAPGAAVAAMRGGQIRLAPPTFVTVSWLAGHASAAEALAALAGAPLVTFHPRICMVEGGACILYPGDAGYEAGDPGAPGPRHRLLTAGSDGFQYERSGC
jgi:8-oxo-dGTP pyrophosphatase MutT (NUDIX family)